MPRFRRAGVHEVVLKARVCMEVGSKTTYISALIHIQSNTDMHFVLIGEFLVVVIFEYCIVGADHCEHIPALCYLMSHDILTIGPDTVRGVCSKCSLLMALHDSN